MKQYIEQLEEEIRTLKSDIVRLNGVISVVECENEELRTHLDKLEAIIFELEEVR